MADGCGGGDHGASVRIFKWNPFGSSRRESALARYVLREHERGRPLAEIMEDPYVRNWSTAEERARLLERPEVVSALGGNALAELRQAVR